MLWWWQMIVIIFLSILPFAIVHHGVTFVSSSTWNAISMMAATTSNNATSNNNNNNNASSSSSSSCISTSSMSINTKTIVMVEFIQETNSFSPVLTLKDSFASVSLASSVLLNDNEDSGSSDNGGGVDAIWRDVQREQRQLAGFQRAIQEKNQHPHLGGWYYNVTIAPIFKACSMSGGPIAQHVYEEFKETILMGIIQQQQQQQAGSSSSSGGGVDGVYLSLHGAMGVVNYSDPEGDLIEAIRSVVGPNVPIAVTFDLHANITPKRVQLVDIMIGFHTNPHRDHFDVGYRAGSLLVQTIYQEITPQLTFLKLPLLRGGGMTMDFLWPMRSIFQRMKYYEQQYPYRVLDVSNYMVHIWLDDTDLGWSVTALTNNNNNNNHNNIDELGELIVQDIAQRNWNAKDAPIPNFFSPEQAIAMVHDVKQPSPPQQPWQWWWGWWPSWTGLLLRYNWGTSVFCDVSDAVGAGAPGENTWILQALLNDAATISAMANTSTSTSSTTTPKEQLVSYLFLRDATVVRELFDTAERGDYVYNLSVGGRLDTVYNRPVEFSGHVQDKFDAVPLLGKVIVLVQKQEENEKEIGGRRGRGGIHLILTEYPAVSNEPSAFTDLGLDIWKADIVVVKNLFPFRFHFWKYNRMTVNVVSSGGTTDVDVHRLHYYKIPRPIYPLDRDIVY